jgi:SCP1.201-like deaminase
VASIQDVITTVQRALHHLGVGTQHVQSAGEDLTTATATFTAATMGTSDPEAADAVTGWTTAGAETAEVHTMLGATRVRIRAYLEHLVGLAGGEPDPAGAASATPTPLARRIEQSRARVGSKPIRTPTSGEWCRSDGHAVRINSGTTDTWHAETVAFINTLPARYRFALAVATHCEAKVAVALRTGRWADHHQHVVIDKSVCGTRDFDRTKPWTCDKLLKVLLPPGVRLTVHMPDGSTLSYIGEEDPQ